MICMCAVCQFVSLIFGNLLLFPQLLVVATTGFLTSLTIWQCGLLTLTLCLTTYYYRKSAVSGHRISTGSIPGYKDWPIVGDSLHLPSEPKEFYPFMMNFCLEARREGRKLVKLCFGRQVVINLFNADDVEKLLSNIEFIEKSSNIKNVKPWLGNGLVLSSGTKWHRRRKLLTPSFHFGILVDTLDIINEYSLELRDVLLDRLSKLECGEDSSLNISQYVTLCSLDIICESAMGVKMEALRGKDSASRYIAAVDTTKNAIAVRNRTPWYWPDFIWSRTSVGKRCNKAITYMHEFSLNVIQERSELRNVSVNDENTSRRKKVFLDTLLDCQGNSRTGQPGDVITYEDIREEVDTFMFAGHDTVSCSLSYTIHLLGAHPDIQQKCLDELEAVLSADHSRINTAHLSKLPYLDACIKESMRLYPPVPWFGRKLPHDTEFGGYSIPGGTTVAIFSPALHRDPTNFPEPESFNPSRWLDGSNLNRHPYAYIPFSAGPRNCIGFKFAQMELKVVLATMLRSFTIQSTQQTEDVRPTTSMVNEPHGGIWVKLKLRD